MWGRQTSKEPWIHRSGYQHKSGTIIHPSTQQNNHLTYPEPIVNSNNLGIIDIWRSLRSIFILMLILPASMDGNLRLQQPKAILPSTHHLLHQLIISKPPLPYRLFFLRPTTSELPSPASYQGQATPKRKLQHRREERKLLARFFLISKRTSPFSFSGCSLSTRELAIV